MKIVFAAIAPHPPIILPSVGSPEDRKKVRKTIDSLSYLGEKLKKAKPDAIVISSPHLDWGFEVPLYFLARNFRGKIERILIGSESPPLCFKKGAEFLAANSQLTNNCQIFNFPKRELSSPFRASKIALIASGDLSHCLKKDGPYGFHPHGPKFDKELAESLEKKDIKKIFKLNELYPGAGECGLGSICFVLGILESYRASSGQACQPKILSYQSPFGVGYLVVNFKIG